MAAKRKTRMYEPWGYQDQNNYQGAETILDNDLESFFAGTSYNKDDNKIYFTNKDGETKASLDVSEFVKSDSIIEKTEYKDGILKIYFTNGDIITIDLSELLDENEFKDGLIVDNHEIKVLIDSTGEPYLSVSENGVKISGVDAAIQVETDRATAAEEALDEKIENEITRATAAESALTEALNNEVDRATAEEQRIDAKLDQEIADREADVDAEETRAKGREDDIEAALNAEKTRATQTEQQINHRVDMVNDELDSEESRAQAAEQELRTLLTNEVARATSAETALQAAITAEENRATSAETELHESIMEEGRRAQEAESALTEAIAAEETRATAVEEALDEKIDDAVSALTDAIEAEKTRAEGVEADLAAAIEGLGGNKFDDVDYDSSAKTINFYAEGSVVKTLDATPFIKDGMIDRVYIDTDTQELVIVWNAASGKEETRISLSDIFNPDNYYTKDEIDDKVDEINSAITAVEGDITTIQGDIVDINSAITEIQGDITTIEGDITNINSSITEINSSITEINEAIDDMKGQYGDEISALTDSVRELEETVENDEFAISMALNDLNTRKLDASAYTPTDLSNYYTKDETSASTEIADALDEKANLSDIPSVTPYADSVKYNSTTHFVEFYHGTTAGTKVFEYDASPFLVDGMVESVEVVTVDDVKYLRITWNSAAGGQVTDIPLGDLFDPSLYYTKDEIDAAEYTISKALVDLDERKLDASAYTPTDLSNYYTKAETDARDLWVTGTGANAVAQKGGGNTASGDYSHAEGDGTTASSWSSHAEGFHTRASGGYSHAEGYGTVANGNFTHVEGKSTTASTSFAHAEGEETAANGAHSHAEGYKTVTNNDGEHASGKFNVSTTGQTTAAKTLFSIGNGTANDARHNAFEVRENGDIYITINGSDVLLQDYITQLERITAQALIDLDSRLRALEG